MFYKPTSFRARDPFADAIKVMSFINKRQLEPTIHVLSSATGPEVYWGDRKYLLFSSNNFLGLSNHPKVKAAAIEAVRKYGTGTGGSRLLAGTFDIHLQLERDLAAFKRGEDAVLFSSGYATNVGVLTAFLNVLKIGIFQKKRSVVFSDELNHASLIDGIKLSGANKVIYRHNDMQDLYEKLKSNTNRSTRALIVTDGIFSMDGDIAALPEIVLLAKKFNCAVLVDEAHATGVLGQRGAGAVDHFNLEGEVDIDMGTCSKALAANGGYIVTSKKFADYTRLAARSYMFSTSLSPILCASIRSAVAVIQDEPGLRTRLQGNANRLRKGLQDAGFNTLNSQSQIVPILFGSPEKAIKGSQLFLDNGIIAPNVRWPAVAKNMSRIRLVVMATHTPSQIDFVIKTAKTIGKKMKVI